MNISGYNDLDVSGNTAQQINTCSDVLLQDKEWVSSLKGIAISMVVLLHICHGLVEGIVASFALTGARGVQMFFIISVYLIYTSLERYCKKESIQKLTFKTAKRWLVKKFIRIAPLFYSVMIFYMICNIVLGNTNNYTLGNILSHLFLVNGFFPKYINGILGYEWYVSNLIIVYFLSIILYRYVNTLQKALVVFFVSAWGSLLLSYALRMLPFIKSDIYNMNFVTMYSILIQFPVIVFGVVVYFVLEKTSYIKINKGKKYLSYAILSFALSFYASLVAGTQTKMFSTFVLYALIFGGIIFSQAIHACPLVVNKFWTMLGKQSYGIYLSHMPIMYLFERNVPFNGENGLLFLIIKWCIIMIFSYFTAVVASKYIEKPIVAALTTKFKI